MSTRVAKRSQAVAQDELWPCWVKFGYFSHPTGEPHRRAASVRGDDLHLVAPGDVPRVCSVSVLRVHHGKVIAAAGDRGARVSEDPVDGRDRGHVVWVDGQTIVCIIRRISLPTVAVTSQLRATGCQRQQSLPDLPGKQARFFLFKLEDALDDRRGCVDMALHNKQ